MVDDELHQQLKKTLPNKEHIFRAVKSVASIT
jgi:hypothetical protein